MCVKTARLQILNPLIIVPISYSQSLSKKCVKETENLLIRGESWKGGAGLEVFIQ